MKTVLAVLLLSLVPCALQAQKKPSEVASLDKIEIRGEVKPDATVTGIVHVKLAKGYHSHSNKPSEPNFIPTVLSLTATPGVKVGKITYPTGKSEKVEGLEKPLSVYEDEFSIEVSLTLDDKAVIPVKIPASLKYQACRGATCYAPTTLKFDMVLGASSK